MITIESLKKSDSLKKNGVSFGEFEKCLKISEKEDIEKWDNYMEWKGYEKVLQRLIKEKKELEVGDYKVALKRAA